jgi:hypothetical protein
MPEVCSHNISLADSCSACVQESMALQPVWKMVPDLMKNSKYQREGQGPECTVERDGKKYEIRNGAMQFFHRPQQLHYKIEWYHRLFRHVWPFASTNFKTYGELAKTEPA